MQRTHGTSEIKQLVRLVVNMCALLTIVSSTFGQVTGSAKKNDRGQDPLATRQQIVRDRMTQLEDRMFRLAEKLGETEPQQAERLEKALRQARELLIRRNMNETIELLERAELAIASDRQTSIGQALQQVLTILQAEPDRTKTLQNELDRLRAFHDRVNALLDQQRQLKTQTNAQQDSPAKAADQQRGLQKQAEQLAGAMKGQQQTQSLQGKGQQSQGQTGAQGGQASESGPSLNLPAPGTKNVQQSSQHMKDAGNNLQQQARDRASQDQKKAIDELEQARQALEQALDALRQEQAEEVLQKLESLFRAMLVKQVAINQNTETLFDKGLEKWTRNDELTLVGMNRDEAALADEAAEAHRLLTEDGTTLVFPEIVKQVRADMLEVAQRLGEKKIGAATQQIETDIIRTLAELIEAMKQLPMPGGGGSGQQDSSCGKAALLPSSAELKMLRFRQRQIHRDTKKLHKTQESSQAWDASQQRVLKRITNRQKDIADMANKMDERLKQQSLMRLHR